MVVRMFGPVVQLFLMTSLLIIHASMQAQHINRINKHEKRVEEKEFLNMHPDSVQVQESKRPTQRKDFPNQLKNLVTPKEDTQDDALQEQHYAFTAVCNNQVNYFPGQFVIFNDIVTNEGNAYINSTGQFVCRDSDVYVFSWSLTRNGTSASGMRVIGKLQFASEQSTDDVKVGPKVNIRSTGSVDGNSQMTALVQCSDSSLSTVRVVIEPWSDDEPVRLSYHHPGFSGFRLGDPDSVVGFVAELSADTNKFPGDRIIFNTLLENYGDSYDPFNGVFTCPDNSTYVFIVTTQAKTSGTWSVSRLMMEYEQIALGPITHAATSSLDSGSASITAITNCREGGRVTVESHPSYNNLYNSYGARLTSFAGFRVQGEDDDVVAFMAVLDSNFTVSEGNASIVMDRVLLNNGEAYDNNTGSFFCPDNDLYMFTLTIVTIQEAESGIFMDEKLLRLARSTESTSIQTSGSSTVSVITRCQPGGMVHTMHVNIAGRTYLADHTYFSGFKLPGHGSWTMTDNHP